MKRVYLSPSSQHANLGIIPGYVEEEVCNRIADSCQMDLERHGVIVGRNNPDETYREHVRKGNLFGPDAYICIHSNAASAITASGLRAGCYEPGDPDRPSTILNRILFNQLAPLTPSEHDRITTYRFYEVVNAVAPVSYLELSFHSKPEDATWLNTNTVSIGEAIARGILEFLGIDYIELSQGPLYRVQVGAFRNQAYAEKLKARLIAEGYQAIIKTEGSEK